MTVNADDFKKALQNWASGVTIITTDSPKHGLLGMTASSFTSVSMDPPHILVCINDSALTAAGIKESQCFAVNILNAEQQVASNLFAGGASEQDRFASVNWTPGFQGVPILNDSMATLECTVINQVRSGSHWVIIGEVKEVTCRSGWPLLYFRTKYRKLVDEE